MIHTIKVRKDNLVDYIKQNLFYTHNTAKRHRICRGVSVAGDSYKVIETNGDIYTLDLNLREFQLKKA